ncbi:putative uncharacterized protein C19orf81 homolog isoform X2 [Anneissia japonica]|nr:putative uncharacterized protein C19orf81 homolog isoform X2 [Anneissia japonica]
MPISSSAVQLTHFYNRKDYSSHPQLGKYSSQVSRSKHLKLPVISMMQEEDARAKLHHAEVSVSDSDSRENSPKRHVKLSKRHQSKHNKKSQQLQQDFSMRKIRFFSKQPESRPLTVCFPYPGVDLSHREVLDAIKGTRLVDVNQIESIQFIDMNTVLGTAGADNRWLINVKDYDTRYLLLRDGMRIKNTYVNIRRYDDVTNDEYRDFLRRKSILESDATNAIQRLLDMSAKDM